MGTLLRPHNNENQKLVADFHAVLKLEIYIYTYMYFPPKSNDFMRFLGET